MIYLDHNASSPVRPEVLEAMLPFLRDDCGNASSVHAAGSRARCAVEKARAQVAALIGAHAAEIVFTSGGTEANNLALFGAVRANQIGRIVTTPIEHSSVREPVAALLADGRSVHTLPIAGGGEVAASDLGRMLGDGGSTLVSVGWANNEIGTIQPIGEIAGVCESRRALLHVDAVQALGKIAVDVCGVQLLSMSAHKIGGPQGVGALFVRRGVELLPLLLGGAQERGRRAGSENVAAIVGMGEACRLAMREVHALAQHCAALRDALWRGLRALIPGVRRNGPSDADGLPNTLNLRFEGVCGEALVASLDVDGVAVSSGSACAAGAAEPSHVLLAMGRDADEARNGVRFSVGRTNTMEEIDHVVHLTAKLVQRVRGVREAMVQRA